MYIGHYDQYYYGSEVKCFKIYIPHDHVNWHIKDNKYIKLTNKMIEKRQFNEGILIKSLIPRYDSYSNKYIINSDGRLKSESKRNFQLSTLND